MSDDLNSIFRSSFETEKYAIHTVSPYSSIICTIKGLCASFPNYDRGKLKTGKKHLSKHK
jgi:hypothetical protein